MAEEVYPVADNVKLNMPHIDSMEKYKEMWEASVNDTEGFFGQLAQDKISWFRKFDTVLQGGFEHGDVAWFVNGKTNLCYNCVDRHPDKSKTAIIWEGDKPDEIRKISYGELQREVCKMANVLKSCGVKKGDRVCIYMPMVPEAAMAMLACARIGAVHSVVFAGFSAEALRARIIDSECKVVMTADEGLRAGKVIALKKIVDQALSHSCECVDKCLVYKRTGSEVGWVEGRDLWLMEAMATERPYCACEEMDSEDTLFLLYTSGSTGKPKGMAHTTAGYLLWASFTHQYVFDYKPGEVYACVADIGWITGHSYIVYGPLCNNATTVMFESLPTFPDAGRYWDMVQRHKINAFYTAPTAIRALMKFGDEPVLKYDLSSLRVLGTVGEPINPEAWRWYYNVVGKGKCAIVDTFWQTETGGHMLTPLPGCTPMKPGSACFPFFGVQPAVIDATSGTEIAGNDVSGVCCFAKPWPGMARTIYGDHERYLATYLKPYPGYYFTGDGCNRDKDGYYWITGRVDDVLNVSGHRMGTAEVESALVLHKSCVEAAVVGVPHDIKGVGIFAYCILAEGFTDSEETRKALKMKVREEIGGIATPEAICCIPGLPKTRSGKIMRRILRKIAAKEATAANYKEVLGDTSTLADPSIVEFLIEKVAAL